MIIDDHVEFIDIPSLNCDSVFEQIQSNPKLKDNLDSDSTLIHIHSITRNLKPCTTNHNLDSCIVTLNSIGKQLKINLTKQTLHQIIKIINKDFQVLFSNNISFNDAILFFFASLVYLKNQSADFWNQWGTQTLSKLDRILTERICKITRTPSFTNFSMMIQALNNFMDKQKENFEEFSYMLDLKQKKKVKDFYHIVWKEGIRPFQIKFAQVYKSQKCDHFNNILIPSYNQIILNPKILPIKIKIKRKKKQDKLNSKLEAFLN